MDEALDRIRLAKRESDTELDLSGLGLESLPSEIGQLNQLTTLDLYSNQLSSFPPEIGQLTQLARLDMDYNQVTSVPPEIGQLTQLRILNLEGNQVSSVPPEIGQLTLLTQLYLSNNQLSSLPPEIGQLTQLTELRLRNNQLSSLPPEFGQLTQLTMLNLDDNQLSSLPSEIGQLTQLTQLYLSNNQLSSLPPEIGQLTSLVDINLNNNKFASLSDIPIFLLRVGASLDENPFLEDEASRILRSIEFPPEYKTAGMSVLSYFGRFVEQKYPGLDVAVSIHQEGNVVSMTIETPDGNRETVERALEEYSLVVTEKKAPEEVLDDKIAIIELRFEISLLKARIESLRETLLLKDASIADLNRHLTAAISKPIYVEASATAQAHAAVDFNFQLNLAQLQGTLSVLEKRLPEGEEREAVQETAAALEEIEGESDPAKVRKSGAWSTVRRFAKKLSKGRDTLRKTIKEVKDGRDMLQDIETAVGKIAQWLEVVGPGLG